MPGPTDDPRQLLGGIATIMATVFAMALADAIVKYSSSEMTLWQIWVLRSLIVVPILAVVGHGRISSQVFGWVLLRSLALVLMYLGIYAALPLLDLSVVAASLYTAPLFITALSAIVLHEPVGGRHWLAIAIGFAGVLLIVRPATAAFTPLALIPASAALLYAIAAVITRMKCAAVPARILALWLNLTLLACGGAASLLILVTGPFVETSYPFLFATWQPVSRADWQVTMVLSALMIGIGVGLAKAYKSPRPQVIAAFDYSFLIFASFWGYVFFGEVPQIWAALGMVLIAGSGILILAAEKASSREPIR